MIRDGLFCLALAVNTVLCHQHHLQAHVHTYLDDKSSAMKSEDGSEDEIRDLSPQDAEELRAFLVKRRWFEEKLQVSCASEVVGLTDIDRCV